jgi:hypothetical protein
VQPKPRPAEGAKLTVVGSARAIDRRLDGDAGGARLVLAAGDDRPLYIVAGDA